MILPLFALLLVLLPAPTAARAPTAAPPSMARLRSAAPPPPRDTIAITLGRAADGLAVEVAFTAGDDGRVALDLPSRWASQDRLWEDVSGLRALSRGATIDDGGAPDRRAVRAPAGARVRIGYTLRADTTPPDHDAYFRAFVRPEWFVLLGWNALVLPAPAGGAADAGGRAARGEAADSVVVTLDASALPAAAVFATSFGQARRQRFTTTRAALRNALFVGGDWRARRLPVRGGDVRVLTHGAFAIPDDSLARAVAAVLAAERAFWNDAGAQRYLVATVPSSRGTLGGTRYTDGLLLDIDTAHVLDADALALIAHESFHEWLGGRAAPADGQEEVLKWFTEGLTDYYADRLLHDAGLESDSAFARDVNRALRDEALSAYRDSSNAAVARDYWTNDAAKQLPYARGRAVAIELDPAIRTATRGRLGIDDVVRRIVRDAATTPLTQAAVIAAFRDAAGAALAARLADRLDGRRAPALAAGALGPGFTLDTVDFAPFDAGFDVRGSWAQRRVRGVEPDGPAARAGLRDGMAMTGVDISGPEHEARVRVKDEKGERLITYRPLASRRYRIPRFTPRRPDPALHPRRPSPP